MFEQLALSNALKNVVWIVIVNGFWNNNDLYQNKRIFHVLYKIYINEAHSFIKPTIIEYFRKGQIRAISLTVEDLDNPELG